MEVAQIIQVSVQSGAILDAQRETDLARCEAAPGLFRIAHHGELVRVPGDDPLKRLYEAVGGHALALELAAARVKDNARFERTLERLETRIAGGDVSDIALDVKGLGKDVSLAASFEESLDALRDAHPKLAELFPMLGVFAEGAPFDADAVAAVWDTPVDEEAAEDALDTLVGYALLIAEEGRFTQHMLLRAYALGLLNADAESARAAQMRHFEYYRAVAATFSDETWRQVDDWPGEFDPVRAMIATPDGFLAGRWGWWGAPGGLFSSADGITWEETELPVDPGSIGWFGTHQGRLLMVGDHTDVFKSSTILNDISRRFGFTFRHDLLFHVGKLVEQH